MRIHDIPKPNQDLLEAINYKIDTKTKPIGALGALEHIVRQVALVQGTLRPALSKPHILVFAADHGIANEGVSAYPQEVTFQMVMNFLNGGAAINVFSTQHGIGLKVVDAGVNFDFGQSPGLINRKIGYGTRSFLREPAMSKGQCAQAMEVGAALVEDLHQKGCNVVGFGEMGIGNTSSAAMIMHAFTGIKLAECVGRGTGVNNKGLEKKLEVLTQALNKHGIPESPLDVLQTYGGFEVAMMCGAFLKAAELEMLLLVDGFIATAAFLTAFEMAPNVREYAVFCHQSDEKGHALMLEYLQAEPLLNLGMRLGEGTGCAVAYPILQSAVNFLNEMASFESAGVSDKD